MTIVEVPTTYEARREGRSKSNFGKLLISYTAAVLRLTWQRLQDRRQRAPVAMSMRGGFLEGRSDLCRGGDVGRGTGRVRNDQPRRTTASAPSFGWPPRIPIAQKALETDPDFAVYPADHYDGIYFYAMARDPFADRG